MSDITVRLATPADLDAMMRLWRQLEEVQGAVRPIPPAADAEERTRESLAEAIDDPAVRAVIAERAGEIAGMALLHVSGGSKISDHLIVELRRVVVDAAHRGSGIGRAIIDDAEAYAREAGAGWLMVAHFSGNHDARRFWEHAGFEPAWENRMRRLDP